MDTLQTVISNVRGNSLQKKKFDKNEFDDSARSVILYSKYLSIKDYPDKPENCSHEFQCQSFRAAAMKSEQ